jgi:hypothetical protein
MPAPTLLNDPAHWRQRAQEARRIADQLHDPAARQAMLEVSQNYEQLATIVEKRAIADEP